MIDPIPQADLDEIVATASRKFAKPLPGLNK